jgi:zinc transport system substrate-binding protein
MMDSVKLVQEELVDGMQPEKEDATTVTDGDTSLEMDEHVWTSPANSMLIVQDLCNTLSQIDPNHAADYQTNTKAYLEKLKNLDSEFKNVINNSARKEIIVGDRFPFRYFCEEYDLTYYAAFPGCSADTEASASTIAFLINKVKTDQIPVVFHIELSNEQMCNSICDATGAKSELLNAVHNVSADDFSAGVTYLDLMEHNVAVLKEALN